MEFGDALFQNVESLTYDSRYGDYRIGRVPEEVRQSLNMKAQKNILFASNCELRFIMEEDQVSVFLRRMPVPEQILPIGVAQVFQGDFQGSYEIDLYPVSEKESEIRIRRQEWGHICSFAQQGYRFHPSVTRLLLPYDWGCFISRTKGKMRLPEAGMMPEKNLLVYGSSITHGGNASLPSHTYAFRLAETLGMDLINLGCAGSCRLDETMAMYIAGRNDWDRALFELGVNVLEEWTPEELYERTRSFLLTVKKIHPEKPVFVTDMFYNYHDFQADSRAAAFRKAVGNCVDELRKQFEGLYYRNGLTVMGTWRGLSSDGLHPSDKGHRMIAEKLGRWMRAD
ncbi:MAG: SGNH/GDSL hydrolase family protein [Enterocloster sp.]